MAEIKQKLGEGVVLDHYVINGHLGSGGFSHVYRAQSMQDEECVVIKEYMPRKMATRGEQGQVVVRQDKQQLFDRGKQLFLLEAKILADMKHENIVETLNCFHDNNTVYLVMRFERGENLAAYVHKHGNLSEKFLDTVFPLIINAMHEIHGKGVLHLDIKPENIHIRPGGRPILLDFGAVHLYRNPEHFISGRVLSKGFSAIEQYQKGSQLGPWSDVYALGATMRYCIEGKFIADAKVRQAHDDIKPLSEIATYKKKYRHSLLKAIDWALTVEPSARPQTAYELLEAMSTGLS